ncbi:hypothetical protein ABZP36_023650 [Zizania latifolia]
MDGWMQYLLYGPVVWKVAEEWREQGAPPVGSWWLHLLLLFAVRGLIYQFWFSYGNMLFFTRRRRVVADAVDFRQVDAEWDWDNFLLLQTLVAATVLSSPALVLPDLKQQPLRLWDPQGWAITLLLHVAFSEPVFYWAHRALHLSPLFSHYHSAHHSSHVTTPLTAGFGTPVECLMLTLVMGVPLAGAFLMGAGSVSLVYGHAILFDYLRSMGYSNVEVISPSVFHAVPPLRYLIYTPTYLSLHHREKDSNFCLFMPLFDLLGGTLNHKSWEAQKDVYLGKDERAPDFVFLAHVVDIMSSMHVPFAFRSCSSTPFANHFILLLFWPVAFAFMLLMWCCSKTFLISFYRLRGNLHQMWGVPRYGFQYFIPAAKKGINEQIELAILRADRMGVKVLSLAALNKNEALNGGGTLFVNKHPDLRVRVVHGNTLTAAVILNEIPCNAKDVFLTGATSKLGRAIALYLCRKKTRVLMLTMSSERFLKIQREAPAEFQQYLVQVTKYQAAQNCKTWLVGKWLSPREQRWAPAGTHFHQFVVPPIIGFRRDCTYGKLAAMRLPKDVQGLGYCEVRKKPPLHVSVKFLHVHCLTRMAGDGRETVQYTMERGVVHACHAGGVVHFLEGWGHHEVGAIDVDRIDVVWKAALKHGFTPV